MLLATLLLEGTLQVWIKSEVFCQRNITDTETETSILNLLPSSKPALQCS